MGTYEVSVSAAFAASHAVRTLSGEMEPPHDHDWRVTAMFRATELDADGFVIDFAAVQAALAALCRGFQGRRLNDVLDHGGEGVSAERLARVLADELAARLGRGIHCLRVSEAPGCAAAYYP